MLGNIKAFIFCPRPVLGTVKRVNLFYIHVYSFSEHYEQAIVDSVTDEWMTKPGHDLQIPKPPEGKIQFFSSFPRSLVCRSITTYVIHLTKIYLVLAVHTSGLLSLWEYSIEQK